MKRKRHIWIPDTQVAPGTPTDHLLWAARHIADLSEQPDHIQLGGDWYDMPSLSSWKKRGSLESEGDRVRADLDSGYAALEVFFGELDRLGVPLPSAFDKMPMFAPKVGDGTVSVWICEGNHEHRWYRTIEEDPRLKDLIDDDDVFRWKDFGIWAQPMGAPMHLDGITYCHFFDLNAEGDTTGRRQGQTNAKLQAQRVKGSSVAGHKQGYRAHCRTHPYAQPWEQETWAIIAGSFYLHREGYRGPTDGYEKRGILQLDDINGWGKLTPKFIPIDYLQERYG
ncbi:MAG: hypothetical protein AAFP15_16515 [Bacteroidota bacterium]